MGNGPVYILGLHGAGQHSGAFDVLEAYLQGYTLIVPDLPFHGDTQWQHSAVKEADVNSIIHLLQEKHDIKQLHIIAYSIGAKVASAYICRYPEQVLSVMYIAPDGIKESKLYTMATRTLPGRLLFRLVCTFPGIVRSFLKAGGALKWIRKSDAVFMSSLLRNRQQAQWLYTMWTSYAPLQTRTDILASQLTHSKIPMTLVAGSFDIIIPPRHLTRLTTNIPHIQYIELPQNHLLLGKGIVVTFLNHFKHL